MHPGKKEVAMPLFADDLILNNRPENSVSKLSELINSFRTYNT